MLLAIVLGLGVIGSGWLLLYSLGWFRKRPKPIEKVIAFDGLTSQWIPPARIPSVTRANASTYRKPVESTTTVVKESDNFIPGAILGYAVGSMSSQPYSVPVPTEPFHGHGGDFGGGGASGGWDSGSTNSSSDSGSSGSCDSGGSCSVGC